MGKYEKKNQRYSGKYQRYRRNKGSGKIIAALLGIAALLVVVILLCGGEGEPVSETTATEAVVQEQTTEPTPELQAPVQTEAAPTETTAAEETQPVQQETDESQEAWFDELLERISGEKVPMDPSEQTGETETTEATKPAPMGTKAQRMTYMEMAIGDLVLVNDTYGFPQGMAGVTTLHDKASPLYRVDGINLGVQSHVVEPLNKWISEFSAETGNREVLVTRGSGTEDAGIPEFHTGLAVELDTYHIETTMDGDEVYQQLAENAWKYGFVRRWPAEDLEESELTVPGGNQWHFRYVGIPHSVVMAEKELYLEEYLEYLRKYTFENGPLKTEYEGVKYEIYFCEGLEITVPVNREYTVSGNNVDGFIVTVQAE